MTSSELPQLITDLDAAADDEPTTDQPAAPGQPPPERQSDVVAKTALALANLGRNLSGAPAPPNLSEAAAPPSPAPPWHGLPSLRPTPAVGTSAAPTAPATSTTTPAVPAQPSVTQPPPAAVTPAAAAPASTGLDPEMLAQLAPTVGSAALSALPMLASALAGLSKKDSGSPAAAAPAVDDTGAGLTPEAREALAALEKLAVLYGEEGGDVTSNTGSLATRPGAVDGSGATAAALQARSLFQKNAATAFNALDNGLVSHLMGLAGSNQVDKKAILRLIREVNVQLAELGPNAYTKAGQQKVHQILTAALQKAQTIVGSGQANASETAAAVNQLTNQYLNGLVGRQTAIGGTGQPGDGRARLPLDPGSYRVSSSFGPRHGDHHGGIDLAAAAGTPIYAATGGTVIQAGNSGSGYGYHVRIRSADGTETIYAHQTAGSIRVRVGDQIPAGTVIGAVGSTGNSTGNHLHYEVRQNGRAVDPRSQLAANGLQV
ncbi:peptidoglycan DD-metalloendopeptidase family protein [Nocardia sp. NPDC057440]|uniref:peptidoglycan DD-metalloendopeptidase family protein n=1 Tax=Nocardia sp. NPDC057440 TaxID=3346134 RepID=UPI00366E9DEB